MSESADTLAERARITAILAKVGIELGNTSQSVSKTALLYALRAIRAGTAADAFTPPR